MVTEPDMVVCVPWMQVVGQHQFIALKRHPQLSCVKEASTDLTSCSKGLCPVE
jgi:hypothetical protein